jgi:hypothetical protein
VPQSFPVHTVSAGNAAVCDLRVVDPGSGITHQVYVASPSGRRAMVGSFRLYADALVCLRVWAT